MGNLSDRLPKRLNRRVTVISLTLIAALSPVWIAVAQNPVEVARFVLNIQVEEPITIDKESFSFSLKPGECDDDELVISNSANVTHNPQLDVVITPSQFDDFDFQMVTKWDVEAHGTVTVPFTGCLDPHAVVRDYRVDVGVLR